MAIHVLRPPQFRYVSRARRAALVSFGLIVLAFAPIGLGLAIFRVSFGWQWGLAGLALAAFGWLVATPLLDLARRVREQRTTGEAPEQPGGEFDAVVLVGIPSRFALVRALSRLPLIRQLMAPRLGFERDALVVRWQLGSRRWSWHQVAGAEWRPDAVIVKLEGGESVQLDTCRFPSGWGPDDDLIRRSMIASGFAGCAHNERIAQAISRRRAAAR